MAEAGAVLKHAAGDRGVTLVELVVVVGVTVILVGALGFEFQDWMARYKIESQAKELYAEFINLKADATSLGRPQFVWIAGGKRYVMYDDSLPSPGGDGVATSAEVVSDKESRYELSPKMVFGFGRNGILIYHKSKAVINRDFFVRLIHDKKPDYDCIEFNRTRVNLGLFENGKCEAR